MSKKSEVSVELSPDRTVLRMRFFGDITLALLKEHTEKVMSLTRQASSGFTVFTDLTNLEKMDGSCARVLAKIMDQFSASGVARVIRVIPDKDKDIGFNILSIFHYDSSVRITTCESLTEAEEVLTR